MSTETVQELSLALSVSSTGTLKYPAVTETTSQFMAHTTNTTKSTSIATEARQTAKGTDAATVATSSITVPSTSSPSIGEKSTTLAKKTTTSGDAIRISRGFEATPKSSFARSPTFTSRPTALKIADGTSTSTDVERNRAAVAVTSPFPSYVSSSTMSTSGAMEAEQTAMS
ncbi:unnamed protein product [Haemonchus placei]|uniref:Uncharacterized protein n=1 Tax=Haemonchus placei TaxID=6290 RepID=A0A0N4VWN4_HAEPC|nr:unnamed protein product [Haemonchus placei]